MKEFAKIQQAHILHIVNRMKGFYHDDVVNTWADKTIDNFNELLKKYKIVEFELNQNSYMGVVLDCISKDGQHLIMKNVPSFLNRFNAEISCLLKLPKQVRCKIFEHNFNTCMIVMEKIEQGNSAHFFGHEQEYENLFDILSANKIVVTENIEAKSFWDVVESDYKKFLSLNKNSDDFKYVNKYYEVFQNSRSIFNNETNFLLHGDIHRNNAMVGSTGIKLIDPLGFTAPFVFEFGALCAYELFDVEESNFQYVLDNFLKFVEKFEEKSKFLIALKDVVIKIYIPSLYEACDDHKKSSKLLLVLDFLSRA